jgi:type II secretory pathway component HofQ
MSNQQNPKRSKLVLSFNPRGGEVAKGVAVAKLPDGEGLDISSLNTPRSSLDDHPSCGEIPVIKKLFDDYTSSFKDIKDFARNAGKTDDRKFKKGIKDLKEAYHLYMKVTNSVVKERKKTAAMTKALREELVMLRNRKDALSNI